MKVLYKKICETFFSEENKALFELLELVPVKHIDLFRNQYARPDLFQPFPTPALFIEHRGDWSDKGLKTQAGEMTLRVHIVLEVPAESYHGAPDQPFALSVFDYYEAVHELLTGMDTNRQTGLQRTGEDPGFTEDPKLLPHVFTYKCRLSDDETSVFRKHVLTKIEQVAIERKVLEAEPEEDEPEEPTYTI